MYVPGVVLMFRNDLYTYTIPKACVSAYGTNVKEMSIHTPGHATTEGGRRV